jgi:sugar lactone lactonase YvrE
VPNYRNFDALKEMSMRKVATILVALLAVASACSEPSTTVGRVSAGKSTVNPFRTFAGSGCTDCSSAVSVWGKSIRPGFVDALTGTPSVTPPSDGTDLAAAGMYSPQALAFDANGNMYIADVYQYRILMVPKTSGTYFGIPMLAGKIYTIVGGGGSAFADGVPGTSTGIPIVYGITVDSNGNLFFATYLEQVIMLAAQSTTMFNKTTTAGGLYLIAGTTWVSGFSGDSGPGPSATLHSPYMGTTDSSGNVFISDTSNYRIRMISRNGGTFYNQSTSAGNIYTIAGNGTASNTGDGGPAASATVTSLDMVADGSDNIYFADSQSRIRVIARTTGTYFGRSVSANNIDTVAGGSGGFFSGDGNAAYGSGLSEPWTIARDADGNLLVADISNNRIRMIANVTGRYYGQDMQQNSIYTVFGDSRNYCSGDGYLATSASIGAANGLGIAVDSDGHLFIGDYGQSQVRAVARCQ